jgi:mannose-6-phosphate isomerase-like protein (cupin superfamily)
MNEPKVVKGVNFISAHAGPKELWQEYHLKRPEVPAPVQGKLFMKKYLEMSGLEMSLTVFQPGKGDSFLHRHRANEEVYVVVAGRGQFWIDGEVVEVCVGSFVCLAPGAVWTFRNNGDEPVYLLVIQDRADSHLDGGTTDGQAVEGQPSWPS